jgi:hypothetical protein
VHDAIDLRRDERIEGDRDGFALVRRSAEDLARIDSTGRVDGDEVREGASDIDADADPTQRRISFSSSADL